MDKESKAVILVLFMIITIPLIIGIKAWALMVLVGMGFHEGLLPVTVGFGPAIGMSLLLSLLVAPFKSPSKLKAS